MAASIKRILPVVRNQGVPIAGLVQFGQWIDAIALAAGAASAYTLPTDAAGNKGTILRLTCNAGPIYVNFGGTATVPATVTTGLASGMMRTDLGPVLLAVPDAAVTMSVISPSAGELTIEVWS
jgi:hypothetical protein